MQLYNMHVFMINWLHVDEHAYINTVDSPYLNLAYLE